jgi:RNA polymerase sigma factor (TIGR02999 family)
LPFDCKKGFVERLIEGRDVSNQVETQVLLQDWRRGDTAARNVLFDRLYIELRQISAALLRAESNNSLSTGDLVNEAVLRLIQLDRIDWQDRAHFLALSAKAMRRTLIDHARKKKADKREHQKVTLVTRFESDPQNIDLDSLEKALIRLNALDEEKANIVELRYFGGLSLSEIGEILGTSESTVKRQWRVARAWLMDALKDINV